MAVPKRPSLIAVLAAAVVGIVVLLVALVVVVSGDGGGQEPERGQLAGAPSATTTPTPPEGPDEVERGDGGGGSAPSGTVRSLPSGLVCDELYQRGVAYPELVDYWRAEDQPDQIDVDDRGVPCESLYPERDVQSYWGTYDDPRTAYRSGLYCRDLDAMGAPYEDAVAYWFAEGAPDRMDADLNGIPCETVYLPADVAAYWGDYAVPAIPYEPGLFCRDLYAMGTTYGDAVAYWFAEGAPDRMDADLNGIPCETVYPPADVGAYWGLDSVPGVDLAPGLFCRDLEALGVTYPDAVAYWFSEGAPDRMDADLNGIPCETVYPPADVDAYWSG